MQSVLRAAKWVRIFPMSSLASETPENDVANVTVKEAANRLGVSERRVCKLARHGQVRGAIKAGAA